MISDGPSLGVIVVTSLQLQPTGKGVIYIDSTNPNLLQVKISVSWRDNNGRIVGDDLDLDGDLDSGEDSDGNLQLDSVATIISLVARR